MTRRPFLVSLLSTASTLMLSATVSAQRATEQRAAELAAILPLLQAPEASIDLLQVKLAVDQIIDPNTDVKVIGAKVDDITRRVRAMTPINATNMQKLEALSAFLYDPGPWNGGQVYRYDLEGDPLGRDLSNKLLGKYLTTRRGNCVSMPVLFVIVGQRLGLPVTLATAPQHLFVKYRTSEGGYLNIETTNQARPAPDSLYVREYEISPLAIKNGLFLRPLTQRESVAQLTHTLVEHLAQKRDYQRLHPLLDLLMQYDSRDTALMLTKGNAYVMEIEARYGRQFRSPDDMPPETRANFNRLLTANQSWFTKAEALGWTQPSEELIKRLDSTALKAAQPRSK